MRLTVNGEAREVTGGATVGDVVGAAGRGVAVAVNDEVVPRSGWADTILRDGDRVEILEPRQGG